MKEPYANARRARGVRVVAAFEAFKGFLALAVGAGVLSLLHRDAASIGEHLAHHLHLNPAKHYPGVFLDALSHLNDARVLLIAMGAAAYAALRLVLASALWLGKPWAEWLTAIGAGIYIPFEVYELTRSVTVLNVAAFLGNVLVVVLMVNAVVVRRSNRI
jgi:uncharacterized membrane protein (DUF2068 family)